jgi:hypothetical protein
MFAADLHWRARLACFLLTLELAPLVTERLAHGAEPTESVRLLYQAPPSCPSRADFVAAVVARTSRASLDASEEAARTFVVDVQARQLTWTGRLVIRTKNGADSRREVTGSSCAEVVDALAFFSTLAIDPSASLTPVPGAPTSASRASPVPPERRAPEVPSPWAAPPIGPPAVHEHPRRSAAWQLLLGSGGTVAVGVTRAVLVSAAPSVEVAYDGSGWFSPTLSLGLRWGRTGTQTTPSGAFTVAWTVVEIASCPLRARLGAELALRLCAIAEVGRLGAQPFLVPLPRAQEGDWSGLGGLARLEQLFAGRVVLWMEAGLVAALERTAYYFQPSDVAVQQAAPVGGRATLTAAVRLF